ncbi:hypothetical protein E2C01_048817 [Portunus trituberculatus]|uniref:Uncharacterized protein n=1 Tax=Portunus trituberculatus TaxID=210409 RepID=A0A5B7GCJ9_PORTR|nr:hypothetical protein [Portunus trituberculatus]
MFVAFIIRPKSPTQIKSHSPFTCWATVRSSHTLYAIATALHLVPPAILSDEGRPVEEGRGESRDQGTWSDAVGGVGEDEAGRSEAVVVLVVRKTKGGEVEGGHVYGSSLPQFNLVTSDWYFSHT